MRRILVLPSLVIAIWLAWLGLLGVLFGMLAFRVWNPHFLPVMTLLAVVAVTGLSLIGVASWRIVLGPGRRRAFACLLLGAAPLLFLAGHLLYGVSLAYQAYLPQNLAIKLLIPLCESLMDLEARFCYPERTTGEKVVMISAPTPDAAKQVAAMDRHIRALEARLDRPVWGRTHWVRGPLLGQQGKAVAGLCLGSRPGEGTPDAEGLDYLDRHEVAHCVLHGHCSGWSNPPAVLVEGWAEANSGHDPVELACGAWDLHDEGKWLTLRELTGPLWYDRHESFAYSQGAPLVNYMLRQFGAEKFVKLYTTSRPATFASDCQQILGLSLDDLDAAFWSEIKRIVQKEGPPARHLLERLKLGPGVDANAWERFLDEYFATANRLLAPYEHVRINLVHEFTAKSAQGKWEPFTRHLSLIRAGERQALRVSWPDREEAYLATPKQSIEARRKDPKGPWEITGDPNLDPERSYRRVLDSINRAEHVTDSAALLLGISDDLRDRLHQGVTVEELKRYTEAGHPRVRLRLEDHAQVQVPWRSVTMVLAVDDLFAVQAYEYVRPGQEREIIRGEVEYDRHEGIPVVRAGKSSGTSPDGKSDTSRQKVLERRFEPVLAEEFAPERFLDGPRVIKAIEPDRPSDESWWIVNCYRGCLITGLVSLFGGMATILGGSWWRRSHLASAARSC